MHNNRAFRRIDTLVIIIIAYFLIKWADSYSILPIWCALGAAAAIGLIFYRFLPYGNTGRLIQAFVCIFETYFLITLLPFAKGIKNSPLAEMDERISMAITAVIVYLLIFELHGKGTSETIKKIFKKEKKAASKSSSYTSSTYKRYDNTIYHNLLDAIDFYKSLKDEKMRIFSVDDFFVAGENSDVLVRVTRHPHLNEKGELVYKYEVTVTDKRGNILEELTNDEGNRQFTEALQGLESKYGLQNYRRFEYANEAWNYARNFSTSDTNYQQSQSREQSHTSSQSHSETHEQSSSQRSSETHSSQETSSQTPNDEVLFNGCTDKESLTKRYHQLMKTFHPDNPNGDYEMTQRIQSTYETLRKKYE